MSREKAIATFHLMVDEVTQQHIIKACFQREKSPKRSEAQSKKFGLRKVVFEMSHLTFLTMDTLPA